MRPGAPALGDQEAGRKRHHLPTEEEFEAGRRPQQRQDGQQKHREHRIIAKPRVVAVEARRGDDETADQQQRRKESSDPVSLLPQPVSNHKHGKERNDPLQPARQPVKEAKHRAYREWREQPQMSGARQPCGDIARSNKERRHADDRHESSQSGYRFGRLVLRPLQCPGEPLEHIGRFEQRTCQDDGDPGQAASARQLHDEFPFRPEAGERWQTGNGHHEQREQCD